MLVFSNRIPLPRRAPRRATRHQMRRRLREYQGEQRRAPRRRCITNRFVCFYFFFRRKCRRFSGNYTFGKRSVF